MNREMHEISKEQQQQLIDMLEKDKVADVFVKIPEYIIYDKTTFYRLQKKYLNINGNIELADLKDQIKVFIGSMQDLPKTEENNKKGLAIAGEKIMSPSTTAILGFISITIGLWGELMPQEIYDSLKTVLGNYYLYAWISFGLILIGISAYYKFNNKDEKQEYFKKQQVLENSQHLKFIENLETRYNNRLEQKLDYRLSLELDFEEVDEKIKEDNTLFFEKIRAIKEEQKKLDELSDKHPFILILGKPGSGKTSCLLHLAKGLLERAHNAKEAAVPIIFNLASWNENHADFGEWLAKVLIEFYAYPKDIAYIAIVENKIIPLLDGFDEVGMYLDSPEERNLLRSKCLNSITNFQNQKFSPKQFVICSRIDEYKKAGGEAPVDLKIILKDVTPEKVKETLLKAKEKSGENYKNTNINTADNLLKLADQFPLLINVLQVPIYFNAALQTFNERTDKKIVFPGSEEEIKHFIIEKFIERKIASKNSKYGKAKTYSYLKWLANELKKYENINFELASFQPQALNKPKVFGLIYGLISGLFYGLILGLFAGLTNGLLTGLIYGFVLGLAFCISTLFGTRAIYTEEIRIWNWSKLTKINVLGKILSYSLVFGLVFGLVCILIFGLVLGLVFGLSYSLVSGFVIGLVSGFVNGLVIGGVEYASEIEYFTTIEKPYRRLGGEIKREALSLGITIMFSGLLIFYFYVEKEIVESIVLSVFFGILGGGISMAQSPLSEHFILSFLLKMEHKAPFRMVKFYDFCSDLRLLEKEGGSWRFRHQIIQDYFINKT